MKRRAFLLGSAASLLTAREAQAAFNKFNAAAAPTGGGPAAGLVTSVPLASFTNQNGQGFSQANSDGTTTGWNSNGIWTVLQFWYNFPFDDVFQFVIPAFVSVVTAVPGNSLMVFIDQLAIQTSTGNTTNNNWFSQFVNNVAPVQNYTYSAPVKAGWHGIRIDMNSNAYNSVGGTAPNRPLHGDRLNIIATGVGLPAEPAPQTRDPALFPHSSWHFINTPFGANATFDAPSTPRSQSINGTGGNGAFLGMSVSSFSTNIWLAGAAAPVFTITPADIFQTGASWPVRTQAGIYASGGSDNLMCLVDTTNPRYRYAGGNTFTVNSNGRSAGNGTLTAVDCYNQNHSIPQNLLASCAQLTLADINSGAIRHRLTGALGFTNGTTTGYTAGTQTSDKSGMVWPGCESDANWPLVYVNPNGVPYGSVVGIPPGVAKPGGLTTGGSMIWDCLQHYGIFLNQTGGTYPGWTFEAEGAAAGSPILAQISAALSSIRPNICVMSNPQPIIPGQGFGGGVPVVPLLPGLVQGYPSIGPPPYIAGSTPVGIPIQIQKNMTQYSGAMSGGTAYGATLAGTIPAGSFVFALMNLDRAAAVSFSAFVDSAGNSYTILQPTTSASTNQYALVYNVAIANAIPHGATFTATLSPAGVANWNLLGAYYRPAPPTGSTTLRVSNTNTTASSVTTLSTTLAGVQTNDLVIGLVGITNGQDYYISDPAGFNPLMNIQPVSLSSQIAASSGTVTYNPTWLNASPVDIIAAAFANANIAT